MSRMPIQNNEHSGLKNPLKSQEVFINIQEEYNPHCFRYECYFFACLPILCIIVIIILIGFSVIFKSIHFFNIKAIS